MPSLGEPQPPPLPSALAAAGAASCANCGAGLTGPFCAKCGQHVADFHRSIWRLAGELSDNLFCWDNKLLRTLGPLLTQPGLLTREFMAGRRMRYVQPLRLFLFVGAVCLSLLRMNHNWMQMHFDSPGKRHNTQAAALAKPDPAPAPPASATPGAAGNAGADVKAPASEPDLENDDSFDHKIDRALDRKLKAQGENSVRRDITANAEQHLSWVALALLPFFAFMLRSLYWQRDSFYFVHLIFSLHYHTFLLLFWTAFIACKWLLSLTFLLSWLVPFSWLLLVTPGVYLFLALRQVYGGGSGLTLTKTLFIGTIHLFTLIGGVAAVGMLAVFT
jgi:hypothetical protein